MFKLICNESEEENIIPMSEMKPWDIGVIVSQHYRGEIAMRTASKEHFEVMRLSSLIPDHWENPFCGNRHKVKLLPKGTKITLEVV